MLVFLLFDGINLVFQFLLLLNGQRNNEALIIVYHHEIKLILDVGHQLIIELGLLKCLLQCFELLHLLVFLVRLRLCIHHTRVEPLDYLLIRTLNTFKKLTAVLLRLEHSVVVLFECVERL